VGAVRQRRLQRRLRLRRYAATGSEAGLAACGALLASAPEAERLGLIAAIDLGLAATPDGKTVPSALVKQVAALAERDDTRTALRLLARLGDAAAQERVVRLALDSGMVQAPRLLMIRTLAETGQPGAAARLLELVQRDEAEPIRLAALEGLQRFDDGEVAVVLLKQYPKMSARLRGRAVEVLLGRKEWAAALLREVDAGRLPAKDFTVEQLRAVELHGDRMLDDLVRKHWGSVRSATPEEKLAEVRRLNNDLRAGPGDAAAGRLLFRQHCAACHRLFGEGENLGPDLTHANRKDRDHLLVSIVDPSAVILKEYLTYVVTTRDGRVHTGLIVEQTADGVTLADAKNQRTTVPRDRIESIRESPTSLMPEGLLKDLRPQQLRDLFAYVQGDAPK
jgi:putative heme-binding domain-containing protein